MVSAETIKELIAKQLNKPVAEITEDKEGIEQIKDGRLKTVSIGVIAHDVRCSICGEQVEIIDEYGNTACGHSKGNVYDDQVCYWKIYKMEAKELHSRLSQTYTGYECIIKNIYDKINELEKTDLECFASVCCFRPSVCR